MNDEGNDGWDSHPCTQHPDAPTSTLSVRADAVALQGHVVPPGVLMAVLAAEVLSAALLTMAGLCCGHRSLWHARTSKTVSITVPCTLCVEAGEMWCVGWAHLTHRVTAGTPAPGMGSARGAARWRPTS